MKKQTKNTRICYLCGSKGRNDLYLLYEKNKWVCENCLKDAISELDVQECEICKKSGEKILYGLELLDEGDDGKYYCTEHRDNGYGSLSDDEVSLVENLNNRF